MHQEGIGSLPASWAAFDSGGADSHVPNNGATNGSTANSADRCAIGHANGHINGHSDGFTNGQINGNSCDHANGGDADNTKNHLPASFLADKAVRTVYGPVPLELALDWPVFASYDELAGCAAWLGGRIPTFEEARSIYEHAEVLQKIEAGEQLAKKVPAVNG